MTDPPPTSSQRSIPSHETGASENGRKGWLVTLVVFIGVLLILEITLRVLEPSLPTPLDWPIANMQSKFEQMTDLADDGQKVDIAFVGSSVVFDGIDPVAFTNASTGIVGYNAAIAGAISPRSWRWWTNEVVLPRLQSEIVVIGVASVDLNSAVADVFWGPVTRSRGFGRVEADTKTSWASRLENELDQRIALFRLRTVLREPLRILLRFGKDDSTALAIGPYGTGPDAGKIEPYELTESGERRIKEGQLKNFRLQGTDLEELEGLVQDLQSQGIGVVLLNMPVTDDYIALHPDGIRGYYRYRGELTDLARRRDIRFLDFGREVSSLEFFRDPSHLNPGGAARFSRLLAEALAEGTK